MNACHCLNMQLAVLPLSSPTAQQSAAAVSDFFTHSPSSPFLSHSFLLGQLESKQIQLEALTLVTAIAIPSASPSVSSPSYSSSGVGWVLFRCLGCHIDCFAVEDSTTSPRCVINLALAVDAEIALLQTSAQYSAVFNICIPTPSSASSLSVQSQSHTPRPHSSSSTPSSAVGSPTVVESLRSALEHSIDAERVAMQMRVNQFVAEESSRFSQYERRGRKELAQLVAFISEEDRGAGGNSPQPAPVTPSRSPASPRVSLVAAPALASPGLSPALSSLNFQPLAAFLRRPSCQSPRLQRLLMDGLKHSTVSDEHAADAVSASGDGDEDDDGSTSSRPSSSSSAALALNMGKLSPRQSVVVAVPQLSSLMRKGSRHQDDDSGEEEEVLRSQELIVRWREQEDERERDERKRKEDRKQKRRRQKTGKAGRDRAAAGDAEDDDEEAQSAIFQLDSPTAEDTWTDMQLDSEEAGRRREGGDDVLIISTIGADEKEEKATAVVKEIRAGDEDKQDEEGDSDGEDEDEDEDAADAAQEEDEDGSLSDDEAVAKTSQADIIAIARSSAVSSIPIPSSASATRAARAAADRDVMVPSSLPIPIPTALRQLVNKSASPSTTSTAASTAASASVSSHRLPSLASAVEGGRRDSLHALAAQRRSAAPSHPPPASSSQRTVTLIPEHEPQVAAAAAAGEEDAGSSSPLPHSPPSASSPFIPPHTLTEEPFFSFAKYRHLPGVRGGAGGGMLSSSLPSAHAGAARQPTSWMGAGAAATGGVLFRKEETGERRRAGAAVSGLTAALGRRESVGSSIRSSRSISSTSAAAKET